MNEDFKFNAWDTKRNKMLHHANINYDILTKNPIYWELRFLRFTGLNDKNDTEIYEGDVLRVSPYQDEEYILRVYYKYSALIIDTPFSDEHDWTPLGYYKEHFGEHTLEIVGNIYENPEFLEVLELPIGTTEPHSHKVTEAEGGSLSCLDGRIP